MELLIIATLLVAVPFLLFGLPGGLVKVVKSLRFDPRPDGMPQWNLWHICVYVALAALLFAAMAAGPRNEGFFLFLICVVVLGLFLRAWRREFLFLMGLRDDELPGRFDKLIWVVMLTSAAPIGVWFFRSYRLAHWPEPVAEPEKGRIAPELL
jgi:hypothetical protein